MPLIRSRELRDEVQRAASLLSELNSEDQSHKEAPEQWSNQEILGHLIDSAYNNHRRFVLAGLQEDLMFDGYPQDHWVQMHDYNDQDWETLIGTWASVNLHLAHLISKLPEQLMRRPTTEHNFHEIGFRNISKGEPVSLDFLVEDYIIHIRHHLKQLLPEIS